MRYNQDYRRGPILEPAQLLAANDMYHATADQKYMLGCKLELADGRIFRYAENGTPALGAGLVCQTATVTSNWIDQVQSTGTAAAIGDKSIKVYVGTAPSAHDWDDGWLVILDGIGIDHAYLIKSHEANLLPVIQIADEGGIRVATATTTEISIIKNIYKDIVVNAVASATLANATGMVVGVPLCAIPIDYFGWVQRRGLCPVRVDTSDTLTIDAPVGAAASYTVPGAVDIRQSTGCEYGVTSPIVGEADGTALIYLTLE